MTQERRIGMMLLGVVSFAVLVIAAIVLAHQVRSLSYTIVFKDARGLQPGDKVQLNGVDVGAVRSVDLVSSQPPVVEVQVRIAPNHAEKVRADSTAAIESVSIPNVSAQKTVAIYNPPDSTAPAMESGARVEGLDDILDLQVWKLRHRLGGATEAIREGADSVSQTLRQRGGPAIESMRLRSAEWLENLRESADEARQRLNSPEARELFSQIRERLEAFIIYMREQGPAAIEELTEQWQSVKNELAPMIDQLARFSREYTVELIRQIIAEIEDSINRLRGQSPTATPPPDDSAATSAPVG